MLLLEELSQPESHLFWHFLSESVYRLSHRSAILLHPPGPQQKISASPHPKFGNSLLHILNPPLILFKLSLETFFKFFIIINFLIFAL